MSIVVSHAWVDQIESGGGPGTAKLTVWILAVLGWDFDVSSTIFVELVRKVQLNIVFNGLRVPDFQRHRNGIKSPVRPGSPGSPGSKPDPKASLSPAIG